MSEYNSPDSRRSMNEAVSRQQRLIANVLVEMPLVYPAKTTEDAAVLQEDYFSSRLPVTIAEADRFFELFGYYSEF